MAELSCVECDWQGRIRQATRPALRLLCPICGGRTRQEQSGNPRPKIIVICGSTRFIDLMAVCAWILERDEKAITMGLHLLPWWYGEDGPPNDHLAEHEGVDREMDTLHLRKIDLCDEIFVINAENYIGDSTRAEINYTVSRKKLVRLLTAESAILDQVTKMLQANELDITFFRRRLQPIDANSRIV